MSLCTLICTCTVFTKYVVRAVLSMYCSCICHLSNRTCSQIRDLKRLACPLHTLTRFKFSHLCVHTFFHIAKSLVMPATAHCAIAFCQRPICWFCGTCRVFLCKWHNPSPQCRLCNTLLIDYIVFTDAGYTVFCEVCSRKSQCCCCNNRILRSVAIAPSACSPK